MAKKEPMKTDEKQELAPLPADEDRNALATLREQAAKIATLKTSDRLKAIKAMMGLSDGDAEVIAAGSIPFWPAYAGALIVGRVEGYRVVETRFKSEHNPSGKVGLYTFLLETAAIAGTLDGEVLVLEPGDSITVLEREVLKSLQVWQGKRVGIMCAGKTRGEKYEYWDYQILGDRRGAAPQLAPPA